MTNLNSCISISFEIQDTHWRTHIKIIILCFRSKLKSRLIISKGTYCTHAPYGQDLQGSIILISAVKPNAFSHEVLDTQLLMSQGPAVTAQVHALTQIHSIKNLQIPQGVHLSAGPTNTSRQGYRQQPVPVNTPGMAWHSHICNHTEIQSYPHTFYGK